MNESHNLPAKVQSTQLEKADSSLLSRAISALNNTSEDEALDKLYREALTFFDGIDFLSFSKISLLEPERLSDAQSPAIPLFLSAANQGHRDAQYSLGAMYADGGAVKWNGAEALKWYRMAARLGHGDAAYQIVKYLRFDPDSAHGFIVDPLSDASMLDFLEIAGRDGHKDASCALGDIYLEKAKSGDVGSHGNYAQAAHWFQQAAERGDVESAFNLAEILCLGDGVPENHVDAAHWYAFAAEHQHAQAMVELAYLYERGLGVQKDKHLAATYYRKAAFLIFEAGDMKAAEGCIEAATTLGDTEARKELGELYFTLGEKSKRLTDSVKWWYKGVDFGSANAAYNLGKYYDLSDSPSNVFKEVLMLYKTAADLGHIDAQCALGHIYAKGRGVPQDDAESVKWYVAAAEQGHMESAYQAGLKFRWGGTGLAINKIEAAKWILYAADHQHEDALFFAGWICHEGFGLERDDKKAVSYYQKAIAVENGDNAVTCNLGWMYKNGRGVKQDNKKAFELYLEAAEAGNTQAKNNLAHCYQNGEGTDINLDSAFMWMSEAADDGLASAQHILGRWYRDGDVILKDDEKALQWTKLAAEQGYADAQNSLGWIYETGRGAVADFVEAVIWYQKSADQGHGYAQCNLAIMYEFGKGVEQDIDEAIKFYRASARQMYQRAIDALNRLGVDIHGPIVTKPIHVITPEVSDRVRIALQNAMQNADKLASKD